MTAVFGAEMLNPKSVPIEKSSEKPASGDGA